MGEGYHNYHHEFPSDYRNGIRLYDYDPTKWLIAALALLGQAYDLKRFSDNEIRKAQVQMRHAALERDSARLNWGPAEEELPHISWERVREAVRDGNTKWLVLDGYVLDVGAFVEQHPGGARILQAHLGKDCSTQFRTLYRHTNAAHNLQKTLRVGRVVTTERSEGGCRFSTVR